MGLNFWRTFGGRSSSSWEEEALGREDEEDDFVFEDILDDEVLEMRSWKNWRRKWDCGRTLNG